MAEANKVVELKPREEEKPATKKAKKPAAKKATAKKAPAKKAATKKTAKKTTVKKSNSKKTVAKKSPAKKIASAATKSAKKTAKKTTKTVQKTQKKAVSNAAKTTKKTVKQAAKVAKPVAQSTKRLTLTPFNSKPLEALMTQPNIEQAQKQFDQITKEAANLNREGIDAYVKSSTIFAKGFENLMKETMSIAQKTAEKQMQLAKDAMTSKTINEFSDAQNKIAQTSFDDFMSGATKISEMGVKILTEAIEPINDQVAKSVQKATDAVAAE